MLDLESNKWIDAMNAEIQSMMDNMVWVLVDLPPGWLIMKKRSPVADIRLLEFSYLIAAYYDYEIWQMDVKTTFLNGYLDEDIYMVQLEGFVDPNHPRKVCKLQRFIYGLKQASRSWNKRFDREIKRFGEAAFILGIKIYRDRSKRLIGLSQNAYMDKILKRYKMDNSKRGHIPMQERLDLNKSQGSIMFAVRCTRPDVAFVQNITSRFQQNPGELHWTAVKNILKYLRNTKDMFLVYSRNSEAELRVNCYCNTGFKIDIDDMKSLTGYVSF
ncbi:retrotransposon protein, putative, ty1-copia subclass [Tanacetum coccineum]